MEPRGNKLIEEGAASLKKLKATLDSDKMGALYFSMILTVNSNIHQENGIYIVPIGYHGK